MIKKFVFSLFFLLAVQGITCNNEQRINAEVYGLIDEFQKIIESLKQTIANAISEAKETLKKMYDQVVEFAKNVLEKATKQIDEIIGSALKSINELKKKAQELGIDVTDCLSENEQAIIDMPKKLLSNLGSCIESKIKEAEKIITNTLAEISSIADIISKLQTEFQECGSGLSAIGCMAKVVFNAGREVSQIPVKVSLEIAKAVKFISTIQSDLTICGSVQVGIAAKDAAFLVAEITECIGNKIIQ